MNACPFAADTAPALQPERQRADVMSLWRKRGWLPPTEYRHDFAQSCRAPIYAGMVRLPLARTR